MEVNHLSTEPRYFRVIRFVRPFLGGGRISVQNRGLGDKMAKSHLFGEIFDKPPEIPNMLLKFAYPLRFTALSKLDIALWWKSAAAAEVVCQFFSFIAFHLLSFSFSRYQLISVSVCVRCSALGRWISPLQNIAIVAINYHRRFCTLIVQRMEFFLSKVSLFCRNIPMYHSFQKEFLKMKVTQYGNSGKKFSHEKCQFSENYSVTLRL